MRYDPNCAGCHTSQDRRPIPGGVVSLPGDWIVNQYCGGEGWLGWLALQPRFHRESIQEVTTQELAALGRNIQSLDAALTAYWTLQFPSDAVPRIYLVYFFESAFEEPEPKERFHLHMHVIPRFASLADALRCREGEATWVDGWRTPRLARENKVPEPYAKTSPMWNARVTSLMDYLRHEPGHPSAVAPSA
jgi:diadenosine tetraphosphate (Ap4A) HIT family hydrolase